MNMRRFTLIAVLIFLFLYSSVFCSCGEGDDDPSKSSGQSDDDDDDDNDDDNEEPCPPEMVLVPGGTVIVAYEGERWGGWYEEGQVIESFCIDKYEASQPDATDSDPGPWHLWETIPAAVSQQGVLPWTTLWHEQATEACEVAGKRLPTLAEWQMAFSGPSGQLWPWGDEWIENTCYADEMPYGLYPTGGCCLETCVQDDCFEICDMVGNVSEWVDGFWDVDCYGYTEVLVAGGAAHIPWTMHNAQSEDPENPGCWTFDAYALHRAGLHHYALSTAYSDDGFRCAKDPDY